MRPQTKHVGLSLIRVLADSVINEDYGELSEKELQTLEALLLDFFGNVLAGSFSPPCQRVTKLFRIWDGKGKATIFTIGAAAPPYLASYVNAFAANVLDADDTYIGHPGATVIGATLAIAEREDSSIRDLLVAMNTGYKISMFFADMTESLKKMGSEHTHGMGTVQIFGAAAASAKLLGLGCDETANTLAIAAANAPVPSTGKFADYDSGLIPSLKNNFGWACAGGVLAALLSKEDVRGNLQIFSAPSSFWSMIGCRNPELDDAMIGLESESVMNISFKPYPSCRFTHSSIDCARSIWSQGKVTLSDIVDIEIQLDSLFAVHNLGNTPRSLLEAQFSIPYLVSLALHGKFQRYELLKAEDLCNESVQRVSKLVRLTALTREDAAIQEHAEFGRNRFAAKILLKTKTGDTLVAEVNHPRGDPVNRLSAADLSEKYYVSSVPAVGWKRASALRETILRSRQSGSRAREFARALGFRAEVSQE